MSDTQVQDTATAPDEATTPAPVSDAKEPDSPLVRTVAALRAEKKDLAAKASQAEVERDAATAHAKSLIDANTALTAELARTKLALKYGLTEGDAALLAPDAPADALANRLAAASAANCGLPVMPELGRVVTVDADPANEFRRIVEQQLRRN